MNCPKCGGDTSVIDSKLKPDNVRRRRKCLSCNERFNTMEIDMDYYKTLMLIDKDRQAVVDSCEKLAKRLCKSLNI